VHTARRRLPASLTECTVFCVLFVYVVSTVTSRVRGDFGFVGEKDRERDLDMKVGERVRCMCQMGRTVTVFESMGW